MAEWWCERCGVWPIDPARPELPLCAWCWERVLSDTARDWGWLSGLAHAIDQADLDRREAEALDTVGDHRDR